MREAARSACECYGYPVELIELLERLVDAAESSFGTDLVSLFLSGSAATGDFAWSDSGGDLRFWSDIDAFAVVDDLRGDVAFKQRIAEIEARCQCRTPLFEIDVSAGTTTALAHVPPIFQVVETRLAGMVLTGRDLLERLPSEYDPRSVVTSLLFNFWKGVLYYPAHPAASDNRSAGIYSRVLARLVLDVAVVPYSLSNLCVAGHHARVAGIRTRFPSYALAESRFTGIFERALRARSDGTQHLDLGEYLEVLDAGLEMLDPGVSKTRNATALADRFSHLVPRRTLRQLAREGLGSRLDLAWLARRKEALGGAATLGLLRHLAMTPGDPPPEDVLDALERFSGIRCAPGAGLADLKRQYWQGVVRCFPRLHTKTGHVEDIIREMG